MGWKSFKEHYRIRHTVVIEGGEVLIGSGFIHDLLVVGMDGRIVRRRDTAHGEFDRYVAEIEADPGLAVAILSTPDRFEKHIPVYTWDLDAIVEEHCEEPGYPNATHSGRIMYDNTYFLDRADAVIRARRSALAGVRNLREAVRRAEEDLERARSRLAMVEREAEAFDAEEPPPERPWRDVAAED